MQNFYFHEGECQQTISRCSVVGRNKNKNKLHLQSCHFRQKMLVAHCLHRFLDGQNCGIHRKPKIFFFSNSHEGSFRKSPFCTFSCIYPGCSVPLSMLWIFFSCCHLNIASKECFWPKNISNFIHGFKSAILKS